MSKSRKGFVHMVPRVFIAWAFGICLQIPVQSASRPTAGSPREVRRDSVGINYRQSKIALDTTYMENAASLRRIRERLSQTSDSLSGYVLKGIEVVGAASPEGSVAFNRWLSERRAERIFSWVDSVAGLAASPASFSFKGRDWSGLYRRALSDTELPYREETLELLATIAEQTAAGETARSPWLQRLKRLRGGVPYRYLYRNIFPSLREGHVVLTYERPVETPALTIPVKETATVARTPELVYETVHDTVYIAYCPPCRPFYMNLRSNGLYDLAAIPNIGMEFYLGKGWSAGLNWNYAWWSSDRRHRYWRAYGGEVDVRRWFGTAAAEKPLTGHHLGLYAQAFTYDFEFGGKGHMGGVPGGTLWDRCLWGGGLEYGYSLPLGRRFNLDFSLGIGVVTGKVVDYRPGERDNYVWTSTKRTVWVGPTKAEIALVWQLGCGNVNAPRSGKTKGHAMEEKGGGL